MLRRDAFTGSALITEPIRARGHSLRSPDDLQPLYHRIGDARLVLLGEATHGTHEYYTWRAQISRWLIQNRGFSFVAVEGDWPDCYCVNQYVKGYKGCGPSAVEVLHDFNRWPTWMWANWEVVAFAEWLRTFNDSRPQESRVGFYGLDVYSLWDSMDAVIKYLQSNRPEYVEEAKRAYKCFDPFSEDPHNYAYSTAFSPHDCQDEVVKVLADLRRSYNHPIDPEAEFNAEQNALVAVDAERYYRSMVLGSSQSWNVRDTHMADTLDRLLEHHGPEAKGIVWEHNTHVGDARATDMQHAGMVNIGQLARERNVDGDVVLVGFGSYGGSVIAGSKWGAPMERMEVPDAQAGSWEEVFHTADRGDTLLICDDVAGDDGFMESRGHRAIGVVYHPDREAYGNYVPTLLTSRYDAFIFLNQTKALHPLHITPEAAKDQPDTYPFGM